MLRHAHVGMSHDALNGGKIHAQRLHLRYIGVSAAVRCQHADFGDGFQRFLELIAEVGRVAGTVYSPDLC